jgi:trk system potassium uptake protein TrkA
LRIVIIGAGEVGYHIAHRLSRENKDVVVIDKSATALKRVGENLDVQTIQGSGSSPRVLEDAGVKGAEIVLAVTDSDENNLIACFFANLIAPSSTKVARIRNEEYTDYHQAMASDLLDISMVINPEVEVVKSMMQIINAPGALEINEFADGRIKMTGVRLPPDSKVNGLKLMDLPRAMDGARVIIAALVRDDRLKIPSGADVLHAGDLVYFVCDDKDLDEVMEALGIRNPTIKNILVVGGGNIGLRLAHSLESKGLHVKLVEADAARCDLLSTQLDRTVILHGDGTDEDLLTEENVSQMDMVVALTSDEESNILSCLLAKNLGAPRSITRINKQQYMPLVRTLGLEHIVSPRMSAVHSILHAIRKGRILSTASIKGDEAEALEAVALENSPIVSCPIKDLNLPRETLILAVFRGDKVIIPHGDFVIQAKDRFLLLSTRPNVEKVEKWLTVNLEYF